MTCQEAERVKRSAPTSRLERLQIGQEVRELPDRHDPLKSPIGDSAPSRRSLTSSLVLRLIE
jgi:hypothetical protein